MQSIISLQLLNIMVSLQLTTEGGRCASRVLAVMA